MRILVLGSDNPSPPINGTRIRNFHLWPELRSQGHEVKLLVITRDARDLRLSNDETEYFLFHRAHLLKRLWMRLFHSYHEWPVSHSLEERVQQLEKEWNPDVIHAEELRMGHYLPKKKTALLSLCVHNVESSLIRKTLAAPFPFAVKFFNRIYHRNLLRFEKRIFGKVSCLMTYSELDRKTYQELYPHLDWKASSNGVNRIELSTEELELPSPQNLLFLGSLSYLPNIEALNWLIDDILPLVKQRVRLTVAGSTPAVVVKEKLKKESIELIDTPLELRPIYLASSMLLVPLLSGSGTRGKILEALMYGRAVLTTPKGIEGLEIKAGEGAVIAESAEEFAKAIETWAQTGQAQRQDLVSSGRLKVLELYTWKRVAADLLRTWSDSAKDVPR